MDPAETMNQAAVAVEACMDPTERCQQPVAVESLLEDAWGGAPGKVLPGAKPGVKAASGTTAVSSAISTPGSTAMPLFGPEPSPAGAAGAAAGSIPAAVQSGDNGLAGSTQQQATDYSLTVTSGDGYMAQIKLTCEWQVPPRTLFSIFTHQNNSALFRGGLASLHACMENMVHRGIFWGERACITAVKVCPDVSASCGGCTCGLLRDPGVCMHTAA